MAKRYIVKYNTHRTEYGVYDRRVSGTCWGMDKASATSNAARFNATEEIGANLSAAIEAIGVVMTGELSPERRAAYKALREQLRTMRDDLPSNDVLSLELTTKEATR